MTNAIVEHIARALFVSAYADAHDNGELPGSLPTAGPGMDWLDCAPETPQHFINEAWRLVGRIEQLNGMSLICLFARACEVDSYDFSAMAEAWREDCLDLPALRYLYDFGHCLGMQALGHGVSWFDDHEQFEMQLPHIETDPYQWAELLTA